MKKVGLLLLTLFVSSLVINAQGIYQIWGTAIAGGNDNTGTMFSMDQNGNNLQRRVSFDYSMPGFGKTTLVECNYKFYGVTDRGGSNGVGVLFEWDTAANIFTRKFDFLQIKGRTPNTFLAVLNGKIYGTASRGGAFDGGLIFEWDPATDQYSIKFEFNYTHPVGSGPLGGLTYHAGKFYGTTFVGGTNGFGTIFEWDPVTNVCTKEFDFNNATGSSPQGLGISYNGKIYGIANNGGATNHGVIYEWDPVANLYAKKVDFADIPLASLVLKDGKFYGTALTSANWVGLIYEWDPVTNVYTRKFNFAGSSTDHPWSGITLYNGKFYGSASLGGTNNTGALYEWNPATNIFLKLYDFAPYDDLSGRSSEDPLFVNGGKILGAAWGGINGSGALYEFSILGRSYKKKVDFNGSNGTSPIGKLKQLNGKLYGLTRFGGSNGAGVIFEWDLATSKYETKLSFPDNVDADNPNGSFTYYKGKFYGITSTGGVDDAGVIYEWDPVTNVFTKKLDLYSATGYRSLSDFTLVNDKFYATTYRGGAFNLGVIFEWDPISNIYTKKIDFKRETGHSPQGNLTLHNGKLYGTTYGGGAFESGVIFEWDPASNTYTKKFDFSASTGFGPSGDLTMKDGKFYGSTHQNSFYEWDPITNIYTTKIAPNTQSGAGFKGNLVLNGNKFYGISDGGANDRGIIFEWDLATNAYTVKRDFDGDDGWSPQGGLAVITAPIAKGSPGNCVSFPLVTIDNSNNNEWVPIMDNDGNAVAEIKGNGNNLGVVTASMFVNDESVREDNAKRLYLDRNFTIKPQFQPSSPVDIRLYITVSDYLALKNAVNSNGQASGIDSITDICIFKNPANTCSPGILQVSNPVVTTASDWGGDYVLTASINSFSSFYVANKSFTTLPLNLLEFKGRLENNNVLLNWKTDNEQNTSHFEIERSTDGVNYSTVGTVASVNAPGIHQYQFTDPSITSLDAGAIYYRLKQVDNGGEYNYSHVVPLTPDHTSTVSLYPNPVSNKAIIYITSDKPEQLDIRVIDNIGRVVKQQQSKITAGNTSVSIDVKHLSKGVYYLDIKGTAINKQFSFIKS